jgi:chemotaxis-related protein WspB
MQVLAFRLGSDNYGLDTRDIDRVLPLLEIKQLPGAPDFVAGLMNLQGMPVPVIDLSMLVYGRGSHAFFDTRMIVARYATGHGDRRPLGLIAERVAGVRQVSDGALLDVGVALDNAPYLGRVTTAAEGILQLVNVERLLPEPVRALLYPCEGQVIPC